MRCADDPRYKDCQFVVPDGIKLPAASLRVHRQHAHEGWEAGKDGLAKSRMSQQTKRDKDNFCALYRVVGSVANALVYAPDHYLFVDPQIAAFWAQDLDEGAYEIDEKRVAIWERKLKATEEWDARKTNRMNRAVLQKADQQFIDGSLSLTELGTSHRYVGDNWHWGEKAVKEAYGKEKEQRAPVQMAGIVVQMGDRPPPRKLRPKQPPQLEEPPTPAEFRVIEGSAIDHSGR